MREKICAELSRQLDRLGSFKWAGEEGEMSEDRLGEGGGEQINKKEEFSLDRLELLKTVGTGAVHVLRIFFHLATNCQKLLCSLTLLIWRYFDFKFG